VVPNASPLWHHTSHGGVAFGSTLAALRTSTCPGALSKHAACQAALTDSCDWLHMSVPVEDTPRETCSVQVSPVPSCHAWEHHSTVRLWALRRGLIVAVLDNAC
jgi:hypothetical protein